MFSKLSRYLLQRRLEKLEELYQDSLTFRAVLKNGKKITVSFDRSLEMVKKEAETEKPAVIRFEAVSGGSGRIAELLTGLIQPPIETKERET